MNFYNTVEQEGSAEFKDRGSRFIGYVFPFSAPDGLKAILQKLKKEHVKAVHFCFAYRIGTDGNNFRSSDDGEPSGSAGKPILGQIDSKGLTDVLVVVVRYFGGTLLGVPGLINAYKTTASFVLQVIPAVQKPVLLNYKIEFDYTAANDVMMILKQFNCVIIKQEKQLFCRIDAGFPIERKEEIIYRLSQLHNVELLHLL